MTTLACSKRFINLVLLILLLSGIQSTARSNDSPSATPTASEALSDIRPFRIGTGGSSGTYFPIGGLIAQALGPVSQTSLLTGEKYSNLRLLAQRSNGSVSNVGEIGNGLLESGLVQADVVHWAYHGSGPFSQRAPVTNLRAIATLYLESVHLVARRGSAISSVEDLAGKTVSVDEIGSGTQLDINPIFRAHNLELKSVKPVYLKAADAIDRMRDGRLDAFFIVAGYPVSGVSELIANGQADLIPIAGPGIDRLVDGHPFFTRDIIPKDTYANTNATDTLAVPAQWIVAAEIEDELVYRITKSLWSEHTARVLTEGHPKGQDVNFSSALLGMSIPLHPGASRYYRERDKKIPELLR